MKSRNVLLVMIGAGALLLLTCASLPPKPQAPDSLALLDPSGSAYLKAKGRILAKLLPLVIPKEEYGALKAYLGQTKEAAFAVLPSKERGFQAVLTGSFPTFRGRLALALSKDWRRRGQTYENKASGLGIGLPVDGLIFAAKTGGVDEMCARLKAVPASPVPAVMGPYLSHELLCWIPDPFGGMGKALIGEKLDIPAEGILLVADPSATGYSLSLVFLMRDSGAARLYKPAMRLAWFALSRFLFPGEKLSQPAQTETTERLIIMRDIGISEDGLAAAVARLGQAGTR